MTSKKKPAFWQETFTLDTIPTALAVVVKGFNDGEVWINGKLFKKTKLSAGRGGAVINYYSFLPEELSLLNQGINTIKVKIKPGKKGIYSAVGLFQLIDDK